MLVPLYYLFLDLAIYKLVLVLSPDMHHLGLFFWTRCNC